MKKRIEINIAALVLYGLAAAAVVVLVWLISRAGDLASQREPEATPALIVVTARPTPVQTEVGPAAIWDYVITPTPGPTPGGFATLVPVTPPPVIYPEPRARSGFKFGGQVLDFGQNAVDWMHRAGMQWVKFQVAVGDLDAGMKIERAHARGFRVLVGLMGDRRLVTDPEYGPAYGAYAGEVAAMGADAIEIWNEPNIARDWPAGHIDPGLYLNLLRPSYNAIKATNPNTLVISAGLAPTLLAENLRTENFWTEVDYTTELVARGGLNFLDCFGIHYNIVNSPPTATDPTLTGDAAFFYYPRILEHYAQVSRGTRPVCFTEYGILTDEGLEDLMVVAPNFLWADDNTLEEQGAWLSQARAISAGNA
ncbi:MAG: hypothetical protein ACE5FI_05680, partial [Anaerolineales bacterium]